MSNINEVLNSTVYRTKTISASDVKIIKDSIIKPNDTLDVVDVVEKEAVAKLYEEIKKGEISVQGGNEQREEIEFELKNIANTVVNKGIRSFWSGNWFNADILMINLNGLTFIEPWFTGNHYRSFYPYQSIEVAKVAKGIFMDDLVVKMSGGEGATFTFSMQENSGQPEELANLINQRINDWNLRVNRGVATTSTQFVTPESSEGFKTATVPGTNRTYDIYTSPTGSVAIYPLTEEN